MPSLSAQSCDLFNIPFFQFAQMKKFCPEEIPSIKARYKKEWDNWKAIIQAVSAQLGAPFAKPHIESWTNGWQVRAHFFAYFKYEFNQNSAAIFSVLLNRRRLSVSLDWHCYRADRSQINVQQYNQWLENFDFIKFADFDLWRGDESEYDDFRQAKQFTQQDLLLRNDNDFWCIGKNVEKADLAKLDTITFITETIRSLEPLYNQAHQT
ncbi:MULTISPECIES: glucose-6-phosphate 1-dehydrogenase family protein [Rodentibacter]|uniref:glucose-6-phosphate 1-dehydrogenase family protein n=1 Tax=Rodentibacter TaxID=1960084 RepID=UPI001CFEA94F|nr:glucose-6-phosphate 1-dehydrogenase family protein [Rodentibacter sp. JRC1]